MKQTFKDKLLSEAINFFKIDSLLDDTSDDFDSEFDVDEFDSDQPEEYDDYADSDDEFGDEEPDNEFEDSDEEFDEDSFGDEEPEKNPNKEGLIRSVKGAYLVYKRVTENNNYEELWVFNLGNVKYQTRIRNAILAGTDVDPVDLRSPDNEQRAAIWSKGNVQFLHIDGLPN